ncbi:polysaccharide deacetylase family protein [Hymenobacter caeli]|uniref:Peptidoglycan/xylan/chitin deacetylase (PgdA/CDA1 family) n=1 Tax=Hymenobacter caeli TaxID=2735894 RepID=A0ABX2FW03_9BACT|nr:polysaccharide deacetylase family protein [Hymenobacter caeli]NRT21403.1 peptidoglycan/xylan/chitin deacetylase (PgdA/CDA1 family) [Hymenobacter caeli]
MRWFQGALLTRPPRLLHRLLPGAEWRAPAAGPDGRPRLYLTFDDGPVPEETPWVLAQLARYQARATFFCVGDNLARHPAIARAALAAGHRLANHTHHHRSAWQTPRAEYLADVARCQQALSLLAVGSQPLAVGSAAKSPKLTANSQQLIANTNQQLIANEKPLFRPPYGRLTWPLLRALRAEYRVVLWSVLTRDYDPRLPPKDCLRLTLATARAGDILVFHDSRKASARLRYVLPNVLAYFARRGFEFAAL